MKIDRLPTNGTLMFDQRPIELAGFRLLARSVVPVGRATLEQWIAAAQFCVATQEASPYWVGDLLMYAESRDDWRDKMDQALALTGLAHQTALNLTYVSRHVDEPERALSPSLSHSAEVAPLPKDEQRRFLKKSREQSWTRRELRQEIQASKRARVVEGQAVLRGMYRVIYATPEWGGSTSIAELCKLPVAAHAMDDSVLFCWVTASALYTDPGPREVIKAWGFTPKTGYVWDMVLGRPGYYSYVTHEHLIIATRGAGAPDVSIDMHTFDSVQTIRRDDDEHGEKPAEFRRLIQKLYTRGPYLELFGRKPVDGWTVFGSDARLWAEQVAS